MWLQLFSHLLSSPRISEEAAAMWKKHLERDDSRIVGEESKSSRGDPSVWSVDPLMILATRLSQTCSRASCGARCTARCAPTTPTHSMCSVICRCPSPRGALAARSRWGSVWTSSLRRRNWTRRIPQWVNTECDKLVDYDTIMVSKFRVKDVLKSVISKETIFSEWEVSCYGDEIVRAQTILQLLCNIWWSEL